MYEFCENPILFNDETISRSIITPEEYCLPSLTIEIDDNYYRVFSVCSQLKDQFHYSGRQRENRAMHGSSLAAIWFGHRSWGKQRVRAYFL